MRSQLDALPTVKLCVESEKKNGNLIEDFVGGGGGRTKRSKASQTKASNCREVQSKVETWRNRLRQ
jgi:hypothetical protein